MLPAQLAAGCQRSLLLVATIDLSPTGRQINLTEAYLTSIGSMPLVAGDSWSQEFRVVDAAGVAVDLTGARVAMTVKRSASDVQAFFDRDTVTDIAGEAPGTKQIVLSATPTDGKFTVRFRPGDEALLVELAESPGAELYDIRVKYADNRVETRALGRLEALRPLTPNSQIP